MPMTARNPYRATLPRRRTRIWPAVLALLFVLTFAVVLPMAYAAIVDRGAAR